MSATTEMVAETNGSSLITSDDAGRNGGIILRRLLPKAFTNKRNSTEGSSFNISASFLEVEVTFATSNYETL